MKMGTKLILKDYIIVSTVNMIIGLARYREFSLATSIDLRYTTIQRIIEYIPNVDEEE